MKKVSAKIALALGGTLLVMSTANAGIPNTSDPTTFLGPTAKGAYTSTVNNSSAVSVLGEVGVKNFRLGGTFGHILTPNQRIKVSAEFLRQDLTYSFFSGNTDQWVNQGALGATYQYDLSYNYNPQLNLNAYASHAPSKSLHTVTGTFVNKLGATTAFVDTRRIAGSNGLGISPGVTFQPWQGTKAGLDINYDNVRYNKTYAPNEDAKGLGGTVHINQALTQDVNLGLLAAVRQPFNNYAADLAWTNVPNMPNWTLGVDGAYTVGKNTLPNSYNVSLSASYDIDQRVSTPSKHYKDYKDFKDVAPVNDGLVAWTADPAVYMPEVLAVPDSRTELGCGFGAVVFSGTIPGGNTFGGASIVTIPTASHFTGQNLTFTMSQSKAVTPGNTLSINSTTGVVTATGPSTDTITVTVTATNACGSAVSNSFSILY